MPWVRIDEHAMNHPKIRGISDGAFRLWVEGLSYCQMFLTDGSITDQAMRGLWAYSPKRRADLLASGLWEQSELGVRVHDYLQWNESREHVMAAREHAKNRMANIRARSREHTANERGSSGEVTLTHTTPHHTTPLHGANARSRARGHGAHRFCGQHFCVSERQHDLLVRELGNRRNDFDLDAHYSPWDEEAAAGVDNLLPWLKARVNRDAGIASSVGKTAGNEANLRAWLESRGEAV